VRIIGAMSRKGTPTAPIPEKRVAGRVETRIPVTVIAGKRRIAFTIDELSITGARLTGQLPLEVGQRVRLVLDCAPGEEIVAEVVRVHSADLVTDQAAVRFVELPPALQPTLAALASGSAVVMQDDEEDRVTGRMPRQDVTDEIDPATVRVDKKKPPA
jgi:PilZ domain